jgi:hypothetical protein
MHTTQLDRAVFAAYGWPVALSEEEILKNLLSLNLERFEGKKDAASPRAPSRPTCPGTRRRRVYVSDRHWQPPPYTVGLLLHGRV